MKMALFRTKAEIKAATWNTAAINNNPFEIWVTYPGETYNNFMKNVEDVMDNQEDFSINTAFTDSMFSDLVKEM